MEIMQWVDHFGSRAGQRDYTSFVTRHRANRCPHEANCDERYPINAKSDALCTNSAKGEAINVRGAALCPINAKGEALCLINAKGEAINVKGVALCSINVESEARRPINAKSEALCLKIGRTHV